jgi:hypothetical protein
MANFATTQDAKSYVKGGLAGEPPLASPVQKAVGATKGPGLHDTPFSQLTTAPNTPFSCQGTPFLTPGYFAMPTAFSLDHDDDDEIAVHNDIKCGFPVLQEGVMCCFDAQQKNDTDQEVQENGMPLLKQKGSEIVEKDLITWIVSRGAPPSIASLEQRLYEVEDLYEEKFGLGMDEDVVEKDNMTWMVTRGAAPSMETLAQSLNEVKGLYENKFGHSVDEEVVAEDGINFTVTRGAAPSVETLAQSLNEVKGLYENKFGHNVDEEVVQKD